IGKNVGPNLSILTIVLPFSCSHFHNFLLAIAVPSGRTRTFAHAICRCTRPARPQSSRSQKPLDSYAASVFASANSLKQGSPLWRRERLASKQKPGTEVFLRCPFSERVQLVNNVPIDTCIRDALGSVSAASPYPVPT